MSSSPEQHYAQWLELEAHYNHGYTGNILNFRKLITVLYKKKFSIYFADNLQETFVDASWNGG
jgi:hypothetical protein